MFSIILISHGQMSQGILHSSEMIFGKQEDVVAVSLNPDEGPDDFRKKLEEAIASLGNTEKILFLADLWGGTPFNQASNLINEKEKGGDWLITAGMNLPMVIESYSARFSGQDPKDVIKGIVGAALIYQLAAKFNTFWPGSTPGFCTVRLPLVGRRRPTQTGSSLFPITLPKTSCVRT